MDKNIVRMTAMTARIVITGLMLLLTGGHAAAEESTTSTGVRVGGSVYGGGNEAEVQGDAKVNMETGTVSVNVFGGGNLAPVKGNVTVIMSGGTVTNDVYGGGALADTNTDNWNADDYVEVTVTVDVTPVAGLYEGSEHTLITNAAQKAESGKTYYRKGYWASGKTSASNTTNVYLLGGAVKGDVFGGGLGEKNHVNGKTADNPAYVDGDVKVYLNGFESGDADAAARTQFASILEEQVAVNTYYHVKTGGCVVAGSIFGCNNLCGSPRGKVKVHVFKTVGDGQTHKKSEDKKGGSYELDEVYGGGNMAAYEPLAAESGNADTKASAYPEVIIDGCDNTSISKVYGGGNAASTPATNVTVYGTYEIGELFGGGNGADKVIIDGDEKDNPGANVGFREYDAEWNKPYALPSTSKQERIDNYGYGSGKAKLNIYGGLIHSVYGGSNTKGNVREVAVAMLDQQGSCSIDVDEAYGGGKSAPMDGEALLDMRCVPSVGKVFGGARHADVNNNVTLNITNGTFNKVFGGNNEGGRIFGSITVNVEEIASACYPIIIGELYAGGNVAGYSVYGNYEKDSSGEWQPTEPGANDSPQYDSPQLNLRSFTSIGNVYGGGYQAMVIGDPEININEIKGKYANTEYAAGTLDGVPYPKHDADKIGAIGNVYGGGFGADVKGSPEVNIGTVGKVAYVSGEDHAEKDIVGASITGSVYGGGYGGNTNVTGTATVNIGEKRDVKDGEGNVTSTTYYPHNTSIGGDIYGGSALGAVANTQVNLYAGSLTSNVFGGGMGQTGTDAKSATVSTMATVTLFEATVTGNIYGGCNANGTAAATTVNIKGGTVGTGTLTTTTDSETGEVSITAWNRAKASNVHGGGYGKDTYVTGSVLVNIGEENATSGPTIFGDVYGGGALGHVNGTKNTSTETGALPITSTANATTTVNLYSGTIYGDAYGGGLGDATNAAYVGGSVAVNQNGVAYIIDYYPDDESTTSDDESTIVKSGRIFGCNNLNGYPLGNVNVTINKTAAGNVKRTAADSNNPSVPQTGTNVTPKYELAAVYGGGNLAPYNANNMKASVRINGCGITSIETVYGGGNAAAVPETDVLVDGCYEIGTVFGGGNGKDKYKIGDGAWTANPGANVGKTVAGESIGSGNAKTILQGGYIHEGYGGSNSKGTISGNVTIKKQDGGECDVTVNHIYGAGKDADVEGDLVLDLGCSKTRTEEVYGCAKNANVKGNVDVIITSGEYGKVFGGNNVSGAIFGHIKVHIEETGCTPIIIDELYGCGNDAAYSVYGYYQEGTIEGTDKPKYVARTSMSDGTAVTFGLPSATDDHTKPPYADPEVNIVSCTRIGKVFGGGLGSNATVYGNPIVNINQIYGKAYVDNDPTKAYTAAATTLGRIGVDKNNSSEDCGVFGGGNEATVEGNTTVNVGNLEYVELVSFPKTDVRGYYTRSESDGSYNLVEGDAAVAATDNTSYYKKVLGANILSNVYGGGNKAEVGRYHEVYNETTKETTDVIDVEGNTYVNICAVEGTGGSYTSVPFTANAVTIGGKVFGGGKGIADSFRCGKAMVTGGTNVHIGNGTIGNATTGGSVYGGGEVGRVEGNAVVMIGLTPETNETSAPHILGNVFGAGSGVKTHGYSALLRGKTEVTIQSDAKVDSCVYGGGEIASVGRFKVKTPSSTDAPSWLPIGMPYSLWDETTESGKCTVIVQGSAEIGPDNMTMTAAGGPVNTGHVFGAGKGVTPDVYAYTSETTMPKRMMAYDATRYKDSYGTDEETIIWKYVSDTDHANVWEYFDTEAKYLTFVETMALVNKTDVTIDGDAFVKGSVYGGSENGQVKHDTYVKIKSGQIGEGTGMTTRYGDVFIDPATTAVTTSLATCATWTYEDNGYTYDKFAGENGNYTYTGKYSVIPTADQLTSSEGGRPTATDGHTFYGNVFGGGSGYYPYAPGKWHSKAGIVGGNTQVDIEGGHILSNVYGGNEQTDVGSYTTDTNGAPHIEQGGTCRVNMMGGTVGVPRTKEDIAAKPVIGNLFGAGKGDKRVLFNTKTNVKETFVNVTGGIVYGSVFGGGEDGHVIEDATTKIEEASGKTITIGSTGESGADGNVFGGGRGSETALTAGVVGGNVILTINSGTILGSVYGGGRLASVGTNFVNPNNTDLYGKLQDDDATKHGNITININNGTIGTVNTTGIGGNIYGGSKGTTTHFDLGIVRSTKIDMTGGTAYASVYGGGELAQVVGSHTTDGKSLGTEINISGGTIGISGKGRATWGNVFAGGKGNTTHVQAGLVKTNTKVTISETDATNKPTTIYHNIYGGGAYGSVGTFTYADATAPSLPVSCAEGTGTAYIAITGGTIGVNGNENGMVFGSSRGDVGAPDEIHDYLAWVYDTDVTIDGGQINGSIYGGGENGHTFKDAKVTIHDGIIGIASGSKITGSSGKEYEGAAYPYRGNVYGGGCGTDKYWADRTKETNKGDGDTYNPLAGIVYGNTTITMDGGTVVHNIYGAGAMGSVGQTTKDTDNHLVISDGGATTIAISGGTVGVSGTVDDGNVFGAARGDETTTQAGIALVKETSVTISQADGKTTMIYGNVYGGGETGDVGTYTNTYTTTGSKNYVWDKIDNKEIGGCSVSVTGGQVKGNVFGAGKGVDNSFECEKAIVRTATVSVSAGTVNGNVYGGGEVGRVDQNTKVTIGAETATAGTSAPIIAGDVFGAGAGKETHGYSALVRGDAEVIIQGNAEVGKSVYGGGEIAAVGRYGLDSDNMPTTLVSGGECKVTVKGSAKIGPANGGNVFGAGKGVNPFDDDHANIDFESNNESKWPKRMTNKPGEGKAWPAHYTVIAGTDYIWEYYTSQEDYFKYLQTLALATDTKVSIEGSATVKGSVYGGSESGFVQRDTEVKVLSGEIGIADAEGTITTEGNIYGGGKGLSGFDEAGRVKGNTTVTIVGGITNGSVYGGAALAKSNTESTTTTGANPVTTYPTSTVNLFGGVITGDAYGGGKGNASNAADVGVAKVNLNGMSLSEYNTLIASLPDDAYKTLLTSILTPLDVNGDGDTTDDGVDYYIVNTGTKGCTLDRIFGANNTNGTPKGDVTVHVYATQSEDSEKTTIAKKFFYYYDNYEDAETTNISAETDVDKLKGYLHDQIRKAGKLNISTSTYQDTYDNASDAAVVKTAIANLNADIKEKIDDPNTSETQLKALYDMMYDVRAVYGGGNEAVYNPASFYTTDNTTGSRSQVIIDGCDLTSIEMVYGGGNAAAVPESNVTVNAAYEIYNVYGGGNGKDATSYGENPGADVGTPDHGATTYGTGNANSTLKGGYIHEAYGGSNQNGIIKGSINQSSDPDGSACELMMDKVVGAGKYADIDGDVNMTLDCQPNKKVVLLFAGADEANVNGNITLNITNGRFGQVFGGNNLGGAIKGKITVNVEETGCQPIKIDNLYLGSNKAAYSRFGYYESSDIHPVTGKKILKPRESETDSHTPVSNPAEDATHTFPYAQPELNIISCTYIGNVFGGGLGKEAKMYANPTVNVNMVPGLYANDSENGGVPKVMGELGLDASENPDKLGIIRNVYGGGDAADIEGNTTVNIATEEGKSAYIIGSVFGGGKGQADSFTCSKAMIGKDSAGESDDYTDGNTNVNIGNGTVMGNVYGGGEIGRVERNTTVTIGLPDAASGKSKPDIKGSVFGGGKGKETHGYAALVRGNPTVIIQADAKVEHNVYGGGEIASVARYKVAQDADEAAAHGVGVDMPYALANTTSGNCHVTVKDRAVIGPDTPMKMYHEGLDPAIDTPDDAGHVFGAGKGILPENYTYADKDNKPKRMVLRDETIHTNDKMGTDWEYVDPSDNNNNNVWEYFADMDAYVVFIQTLALSSYANVTIGDESTSKPFVKGSVYGGSENGLVQFNTNVYIKSGQIGWGKYAQDNNQGAYGDDVWLDTYVPSDAIDLECPHWVYGKVEGTKTIYAPYDPNANASGDLDKYPPLPGQTVGKSTEGGRRIATDGHTYYGNVFGGGSGSVPYYDTSEGISKYLNTAGTVKGNTYVEITGGHILTNVYGGCEATNVLGKAMVKMTGGTLGVPRTEDQIKNHPVTCYLFGAGKGDQRIFFNKDTNVNDAEVEVDGGRVYGSVFGGGEDGHVMRHSLVTIKQSLGKTTKIGTTGNTYVDGNIFGGGRGFGGDALTAGNVGGCVEVNIEGGTMLGSIYGGGRLASVGYGLYLTTGAEAAKYGKMRADNEYDDPDNPISKTQDAQAFFAVNPFTGKAFTSTGRGKITINIKGGTIGNDVVGAQYGGNVFGGSMGRLTKLDGTPFDAADHWALLATAKSTTVNINGGTIKRSVYGGGEMGTVTEDATVTVSGGIIGIEGNGGAEFGNVYGGGKGYFDESNLNNATYVLAGIVKGNTNVNINNGTIYHNIYGGGAYGSVGDITLGSATYVPGLSSVTMMPVSWTRKNGDTGKNTGTTTVTIKGGNIGIDGHENGMIFGSSRGDVSAPGEIHDHMAWVYDTHVVIGGDDSDPLIKGSVYGGGENGHVFVDAEVKVHSGTVGLTDDPTYPNRGNVYGAGCGTDTYTGTDSKTYFNPLAGIVLGNTTVEMDGGRVIRTIYGGGAMGSVGTYTTNDSGKPTACKEDTGLSTVNISGGKIGPETMVMPNNYGNVFGAGRGEVHDLAEYPNLEKMAYFNKTEVTISGSALVKGSVYGGSESGHVLGNTKVIVSGGQIGCGNGKDAAYTDEEWSAADPATLLPVPSWTYTENGYAYDKFAGTEAGKEDKYPDGTSTEGGRRVATDGHTFYGNVFGGGSGYEPYAAGKWLETAGRVEGQTEVEITGGHILSNVYGGNECTDVLGTCTVTMSDGTVGVPYPATGFNPALGHLFGAGKGDKRIFFNTWTNVKQATVSVSGGRVFGSVYGGGEDGHVGFEGDTGGYDGDAETTISGDAHIGTNGNSGYDGNVFGGGQGSLTALTAGVVQGNVTLNIEDGQIDGSVYGGGRLASVGTHLVPVNSPVYGELQNDDNHGNIKINLTGGTINQDVFGGSMGSTMSVSYPNEKSNADMGISRDVTVELNKSIAANTDGCVVNGSIFGCNNANGTPKGHSTVHIFRTAGSTKDPTVPVSNRTSYDVAAVYGGGKSADYVPASTDTKQSSEVIIEGCDLTSIKEVYGGGYGAATPGTNVLIKGTYIINNVFGGGFGADDPSISYVNPGANVGYLTDGTTINGSADGGKAIVQLMAGTVNHVYGGSNSKGNIRGGSNVTSVARGPGDTTPNSCTELNVQEIFGGGKNADMFGGTEIVLGCMPNDWIGAIYAGAENADVHNDVSLTLTSGKFERVFGGNKSGGRLNGGIEVNIEESGTCGTPIIIGELYGGGNEAPYSIYGYKDEKDSDGKWIPRLKADYDALTDAQKEAEGIKSGPNHDPVVNVKAFTSIGNIFGGGYGQTAKVVGNPIVNINEVKISHTDTDDAFEGNKYTGETKELKDDNGVTTNVVIYPHEDGEIGVIGNVFGGGNAAEVIGNTNVNIGTEAEVGFESLRTSEGVPTKPVVGADIRGNVYGGGNNAGVTGDTNVVIGKEKVTTP